MQRTNTRKNSNLRQKFRLVAKFFAKDKQQQKQAKNNSMLKNCLPPRQRKA
jgi:hypothetical protein